jgi:hypothetical protein
VTSCSISAQQGEDKLSACLFLCWHESLHKVSNSSKPNYLPKDPFHTVPVGLGLQHRNFWLTQAIHDFTVALYSPPGTRLFPVSTLHDVLLLTMTWPQQSSVFNLIFPTLRSSHTLFSYSIPFLTSSVLTIFPISTELSILQETYLPVQAVTFKFYTFRDT